MKSFWKELPLLFIALEWNIISTFRSTRPFPGCSVDCIRPRFLENHFGRQPQRGWPVRTFRRFMSMHKSIHPSVIQTSFWLTVSPPSLCHIPRMTGRSWEGLRLPWRTKEVFKRHYKVGLINSLRCPIRYNPLSGYCPTWNHQKLPA